MSDQENIFLKEVKKTIANYLIGLVFLVSTTGIVFYFSTTYKLQNIEEKTYRLEAGKADKAVMESEMNAVNKTLNRIEGKLDKLN